MFIGRACFSKQHVLTPKWALIIGSLFGRQLNEDVSSYPNTCRGYVRAARWCNAYSTLTRLAPLKVQAKLGCKLSYKRKMAEGLYLVLQWAVLRRSPSPAINRFTWIWITTHLVTFVAEPYILPEAFLSSSYAAVFAFSLGTAAQGECSARVRTASRRLRALVCRRLFCVSGVA